MSEDKKDKVTNPYAGPPEIPPWNPDDKPGSRERSTGDKILRGCGIALGIAALIFLFIVGACFISLSRW